MGWWTTNEEGVSFVESELSWGDGPADILDEALEQIDKEFIEAWGRPATTEELLAGLKFSYRLRRDEAGKLVVRDSIEERSI